MKIIKVNYLTFYLLLISFLCGFIKVSLIIFFIVIFHELGHAFWAYIFNYKIMSITIYPFGGETKTKSYVNSNSVKDLIIYFGGIIFQIILFLIILFFNKIGFINQFTYQEFIKYNYSIMIFNLLPIIPLDGSLIMDYFLNKVFSFKKSYVYNLIISIITSIIFIILNYHLSLNNYLIVSLFFYKIIEYIKNYKYIYNKFLLERYLYDLEYQKIRNLYDMDLNILQKEKKYYFYDGNKWVNEKKIISKRFDK